MVGVASTLIQLHTSCSFEDYIVLDHIRHGEDIGSRDELTIGNDSGNQTQNVGREPLEFS